MGSGNKEKDMLNILVNNLYITALFVALLCTQCTSEECVKVSDCSCRTSKGQIELTDQIYSVDAQDKARYKYSPCKTFSDPTGSTSECKDVAACQEVSSPEIPPTITYYKVGDLKTAKFQGEPGQNLEVQYTGSGTRQTFVTLVCGTGDDEFKGKGEDPLGSAKYYFTLTTKAACYPQQGTPSGLSPGSVMLILLLVAVIVYLVGGILILRFIRGATGVEMIPNYEFWTDFPILVREGIRFTCSGCKTDTTYDKI